MSWANLIHCNQPWKTKCTRSKSLLNSEAQYKKTHQFLTLVIATKLDLKQQVKSFEKHNIKHKEHSPPKKLFLNTKSYEKAWPCQKTLSVLGGLYIAMRLYWSFNSFQSLSLSPFLSPSLSHCFLAAILFSCSLLFQVAIIGASQAYHIWHQSVVLSWS